MNGGLLLLAALQASQPAEGPLAETPTPPVETVRIEHARGDPLEKFNRDMFRSHQKFDRAILRPAALGYKKAVPKPVRSGLRNAIRNLGEPIVFLNFLLQLKPGKAAETLGRFMINSSLGLGGLLDLAKTPGVNLPRRPNGFGDTLGFYGVKPGPYLFLPLIGPTTLRDLLGGQADGIVLPLAVGKPFDRWEYQVSTNVISGLDRRAEADQDLDALLSQSVDPYASLRSAYLQDREAEIRHLKGKPAAEDILPPGAELEDPLTDPGRPEVPGSTPELQDPLTDPGATPPAPSPSPTSTPMPDAAPFAPQD